MDTSSALVPIQQTSTDLVLFNDAIHSVTSALSSFSKRLSSFRLNTPNFKELFSKLFQGGGSGGGIPIKGGGQLFTGGGGALMKAGGIGVQKISTGAGAAAGAIMPALTAFKEVMGEAAQEIRSFIRSMEVYAGALSPGTMIVFNQAIKDLYATIGVAVLPMFQLLTGALKDMAGEVLPAAQSLAPVFRALTQALIGMLVPAFRLVSTVVTGLAPILEFLADSIKLSIDMMQPGFELLNAMLLIIGYGIKGVFDLLKPGMLALSVIVNKVNDAFHALIAFIGKLPGMGKFAKDFAHHKTGEHAAGTVSMKGVLQLNKDLQQLAFGATADGNSGKSDNEKLIDEMEKNRVDLLAALEKVATNIDKLIPTIPKWEELASPKNVSRRATNAGIGFAVGGPIGGLIGAAI